MKKILFPGLDKIHQSAHHHARRSLGGAIGKMGLSVSDSRDILQSPMQSMVFILEEDNAKNDE
ncbi:MAG: hypothetical protein OXB84_03465 [Halobacteriovoraceae bacterium]|nr:hypothetical protein [Halobacteriovoraceae bacterium]